MFSSGDSCAVRGSCSEKRAIMGGEREISWTKEKIFHLIELLEARENLWRLSHPDYKNKIKRAAALAEIGAFLGIPKEAVEKKIHNLRCQYRNEVRKEKRMSSGAGTSDNYLSKWEYLGALKFLYSGSVGEEKSLEFMDDTTKLFHSEELQEIEFIPSYEELPTQTTPLQKRRKQIEEDIVLQKCLAILDNHVDDRQVFGNYVANALRNLPERFERKLRIKIQEVVINIEKEYLEKL